MGQSKLLAFSALLFCSSSAYAARAIMEGTPASNNAILVDTVTPRIDLGGCIKFPDNSIQCVAGGSSGDNLGDHVATQTISAPYGISASTLTVTGSQFSVGGSTLVVSNGMVGIGMTPTAKLNVSGNISTTGGITSNNAITTSSDVVAHAYYGDGSHLSGLAGTGDAVLKATQTWTGGNTFTGSVTVSSLTVAATGNYTENYYEQDIVGNGFSVNNSTWTNVNYNLQVSAPWSMFSSTTKRITVPTSGFWCFSAHVSWAANSSGYRYLALVKNAECGDSGVSHFGGDSRVPVGNTTVQHGSMACTYLNANEYAKVCAMQTSGGALSIASEYDNSLSVWRVSK